MGRLIKILLYVVAGFVALVLIAAVTLFLVFDQNDFREKISVAVQKNTGRELIIEGDLELSLVPWLAIEIGATRLGNAAGFGDEPFASFAQARLSVRVLPMLLRREIAIGTAAIDSLVLNLQVGRDGRSNWQDLVDPGDAAAAVPETPSGEPARLDIARIDIANASVSYGDALSGERYALTDFNLTSGAMASGEPVRLQGNTGFDLQPAGVTGTMEMEAMLAFDVEAGVIHIDDLVLGGLIEGVAAAPTTLRLEVPTLEANTADEVLTLGDIELSIVGIDLAASVEPFSYAGDPTPVATIRIDTFSPRSLMQRLEIEPPETADPNVLGRIAIEATASVTENAVGLTKLELVLDDTIFKGELSVPRGSTGRYRLDLAADSIDLNRYMAPAEDEAGTESTAAEGPTEIPSDLIRPLNAHGRLQVAEAYLGGLKFETVILELNAANGDLRIHPISASLYEGEYNGDVSINVAGDTPVISADEKVRGVLLAPLVLAMFEQENITGAVNGAFRLSGRGQDLGEVQRSLDGEMSFELLDGTWEGTDVWYELRRARALLKQQPAPEPELPPRTQFSSVKATGIVTNGIFKNSDLLAELPFMRVTGRGTADLAAGNVDYHMTARVLERPEFMSGATDEELDEFTEAVIPLRITGSLSSPSIKPDIDAMLKKELKKKLIDKLFGGRDKSNPDADGGDAAGETASDATEEPEEEEDLEDVAKKALLDLLKR